LIRASAQIGVLGALAPSEFGFGFDEAVDRRRQSAVIMTSKQRCPLEAQSVGRAEGD
jgi:hypothetical protein